MVAQNYQLSIPSNPINITKVETFIDEICSELSIQDELYGNILISMTEAVNNAIIHGNQSDESKTVNINVEQIENKRLAFTVTDQGPGFDFDHLPDPTAPENLEKLSGRGVFLMRQLSDEIDFEDEGRTVLITFDLQ